MTENPYQSPDSPARLMRHRRSWSKMLSFICVLMTMLPAACGACFVVCLAVAEGAPRSRNDPYTPLLLGLIVGVIGGSVVFGLMAWWAVLLSRKIIERPRVWTKSNGMEVEAFFVSSNEEEVVLLNLDGTKVRWRVVELCNEDRGWLKGRA